MSDDWMGEVGVPESEGDDASRRRVSAKDVAVWGGRTAAGLVGLGVSAVVVAGSVLWTPPTWSVTPAELVVEPEPASQYIVCPGPVLRLADDTGQNASTATPVGDPVVAWKAISGDLDVTWLAQTDAGTGGTRQAPRIGLVEPVDGEAPNVSGAQSTRVDAVEGNILGLTSTACRQPSLRSWVIGGSTQLGRTSLLTLVNPSNVEATVTLELVGTTGQVDAPGLEGIVVPAGGQRIVPINGLAMGQEAPMIGVTSSGGTVAAFVQESIIRTLTPGGVDVTAAQTPSSELVIPAVRVADPTALEAIGVSEIDLADTLATLRLYAPNATEPVTATVAIVPLGSTVAEALAAGPIVDEDASATDSHASGPTTPQASSLTTTLTPGVVTELPIVGLAAGDYTFVVTADADLVGGVRASTIQQAAVADGDDPAVDFAWFQPADSLGTVAGVATAGIPSPRLYLANTGADEVTGTLTADDGTTTEFTVAAGGAARLEVAADETYTLTGDAGLHASLVGGGDGELTALTIQAPAALARPVTVRP